MFDKANFKKAFFTSIPLAIGLVPLGFLSGVLLKNAGLSIFQIGLMVAIVMAGSSHYIATSMIGAGAGPIVIIVTTFVLNIRNLIYSSNLSNYVEEKSVPKLMLMSHFVTDEIYAVNISQYEKNDWNDDISIIFGSIITIYSVLSAVFGGVLEDIAGVPIDIASFALISIFTILIVLQCNSRVKLIVTLLSLVLSIFIINIYSGSFNVIISAFICAIIGYILDVREEKSKE